MTETNKDKARRMNIRYQEYEADKKMRLGEEGAKPKRIRYKPISR